MIYQIYHYGIEYYLPNTCILESIAFLKQEWAKKETWYNEMQSTGEMAEKLIELEKDFQKNETN